MTKLFSVYAATPPQQDTPGQGPADPGSEDPGPAVATEAGVVQAVVHEGCLVVGLEDCSVRRPAFNASLYLTNTPPLTDFRI